MKNIYCFIFSISILIITCNKQPNKTILKSIERTYITKMELGEIVKDSLFSGNEVGYYKTGAVKYSVGINNSDTTKYENSKVSKKTDSNKIFYYNRNGDLTSVDVQKGDTTFTYSAKDLSTPKQWELFDENHTIIKAGYLIGSLKFYTDYKNRQFDENGNLTYAVIITTYTYSNLIVKMIVEISYEYLDNIN